MWKDGLVHNWERSTRLYIVTMLIYFICRVHLVKCQAVNHKLESRSPNVNNLRYADDTTLMAETEEKLKSLLMRVKEESEKVGFKLTQHSKN